MMNGQEQLSLLIKATKRIQSHIRCILDEAASHELKKTLMNQLQEYELIESEALACASRRGWEFSDEPLVDAWYTTACLRVKMHFNPGDSGLAELQIKHYTRVMIAILKAFHQCDPHGSQVHSLLQKTLDRCAASIRQMYPFL